MKTKFLNVVSFFSVLVGLSLCSTAALAQIPPVNNQTEAAAEKLGAEKTTQISFAEGKSQLSTSATEKINEAINDARKQGKIEEVRVITWADREYPAKGEKAPKSAVRLADDRAKTLKNYLTDELKTGKVKTYNMAQRPNGLAEIFKTPGSKIKSTLETTGSAPTSEEDTGVFGLDGKASQGVVLIYLKNN